MLAVAGTSASIQTVTKSIQSMGTVMRLSTISSASGSLDSQTVDDVVAVTRIGEVLCLDGESLTEKWRAPPSLLQLDSVENKASDLLVEHVAFTTASDVQDVILAEQKSVLDVFTDKVDRAKFNPDVLLLVTRTGKEAEARRQLHIVAVQPHTDTSNLTRPRLIHVQAVPLPDTTTNPTSEWQIDVRAGSIQQTRGTDIITYDLKSAVPKVQHALSVPELSSTLRLSATTVLASAAGRVSVYNPVYRALQSSTEIGAATDSQDPESVAKADHGPSFITYFRLLNIATAIKGAELLAMQLEAPLSQSRKRSAEGLLVDSIGRGMPKSVPVQPRGYPIASPAATFGRGESSGFVDVPVGLSWRAENDSWRNGVKQADELYEGGDLVGFERFLAEKLRLKIKSTAGANASTRKHEQADGEGGGSISMEKLEWQWPDRPDEYVKIDRRWALYIIRKVFSLHRVDKSTPDGWLLRCQMPDSNLLTYLVYSGALTTGTVRMTFREQLQDVPGVDVIVAQQVARELADLDVTMELLLAYLQSTALTHTELLSTIKLILISLELVPGSEPAETKLLTFRNDDQEGADAPLTNGVTGEQGTEEPAVISSELDRLEHEIDLTTSYLHNDTLSGSVRARCLSLALARLATCPAMYTIHGLRSMYTAEETLALIQILRMELIKDGWTTRYQDTMSQSSLNTDEASEEPPPDASIRLIADLLCRCIDAVGAAGWLVHEGVLNGLGDPMGSAEFLGALKLEVSAALEGIQEAVYLRGLLAETVRYGTSLQRVLDAERIGADKKQQRREMRKKRRHAEGAEGQTNGDHEKDVQVMSPNRGALQLRDPQVDDGLGWTAGADLQMLPLGLKVPAQISAEKVVAGGEIVRRSVRERGHLISQTVGAYSLERIVI
jgi:hypothetical protein